MTPPECDLQVVVGADVAIRMGATMALGERRER
jgi:hypothetical protein